MGSELLESYAKQIVNNNNNNNNKDFKIVNWINLKFILNLKTNKKVKFEFRSSLNCMSFIGVKCGRVDIKCVYLFSWVFFLAKHECFF